MPTMNFNDFTYLDAIIEPDGTTDRHAVFPGPIRSHWMQPPAGAGLTHPAILAFETGRCGPAAALTPDAIAAVRAADRARRNATNPAAVARAEAFLTDTLADLDGHEVEAALGHPHYELCYLPPGLAAPHIAGSSHDTAQGILNEIHRITTVTQTIAYTYWCSETELMVGIAAPDGPQGPADYRQWQQRERSLLRLIAGPDYREPASLRHWSNLRRLAYEPGYRPADIAHDDSALERHHQRHPEHAAIVDGAAPEPAASEHQTLYDLVKLSRWGYGLPAVKKAEYANVHDPNWIPSYGRR